MAAVRHLGFVMTLQYCIAGYIFVVQILSRNFIWIGTVVSEILAVSWAASTMDYFFLAARLSFTFIYTCIFFSWQINSAAAHKSAFWLYIMDHSNFGVAHALYHMTLSRGVQNNHSYEIFDPYLPIQYATFMRL